jgi:hypothetical protein
LATEAHLIEVVCTAAIARLRPGMTAIVDRNEPAVRRLIRGGYLVPTGVEMPANGEDQE